MILNSLIQGQEVLQKEEKPLRPNSKLAKTFRVAK